MMALRSTFDRVFDDRLQSMGMLPGEDGGNAFSLAVDVAEDEHEYVLHASTPGIAEEDLDITIDNHVLTIAGEFKSETKQEDARYLVRERRSGLFRRSITLPAAIDEDAIEADFQNGVLTVHLPKAESAKPKRIAIQNRKTIEAKAS
jgi:HSP20 family protein